MVLHTVMACFLQINAFSPFLWIILLLYMLNRHVLTKPDYYCNDGMIIQRLVSDSISQPLERVDDHVSREDNEQSSEPEVLALVHCHCLLDVGSGVCVSVSSHVLC